MNKILVINCGSSSIKVALFTKKLKLISEAKTKNVTNHETALKKILDQFDFEDPSEIEKIGHRVVHGGEKYIKPIVVNKKILKDLEKLNPLAPLHNPHNLKGIKICMKLFPKAKQIAVFDTAFHSTLPEEAYLYGLPYSLYKKGIRKYGFHGSSIEYCTQQTKKVLGGMPKKMIICHIGNGTTISAVKNGKSFDTSMGFTPLEGPIMGTRSGSIDPGILIYLQKALKLPIGKIEQMLWKESGIKGLSGKTHDLYQIVTKAPKQTKELVLKVLAYQITKKIGSYAAAMNGLDCLVFTAGIGEKAWYLRKDICKNLEYLGLKLDTQKNKSSINETDKKIQG